MLPEDLEQMLRCEARKQGYDVDDDVGDLIQEAEFLLGKQKKINRPTGYVWRRDDGLPYGPNYLYKHFKKIMTKLGLPAMRVHDLRHSFATFLLLKGVDIKIVAAILGHKREDFTRHTYEHILPAMQQQGTDAVNGLIKKAREKKER
jgi:integrase